MICIETQKVLCAFRCSSMKFGNGEACSVHPLCGLLAARVLMLSWNRSISILACDRSWGGIILQWIYWPTTPSAIKPGESRNGKYFEFSSQQHRKSGNIVESFSVEDSEILPKCSTSCYEHSTSNFWMLQVSGKAWHEAKAFNASMTFHFL